MAAPAAAAARRPGGAGSRRASWACTCERCCDWCQTALNVRSPSWVACTRSAAPDRTACPEAEGPAPRYGRRAESSESSISASGVSPIAPTRRLGVHRSSAEQQPLSSFTRTPYRDIVPPRPRPRVERRQPPCRQLGRGRRSAVTRRACGLRRVHTDWGVDSGRAGPRRASRRPRAHQLTRPTWRRWSADAEGAEVKLRVALVLLVLKVIIMHAVLTLQLRSHHRRPRGTKNAAEF